MTTTIILVAAFASASFIGARVLISSRMPRRAPDVVDLRASAAPCPTTLDALASVTDCRATSGLEALQLLGEVHEAAEAGSSTMTSSPLLLRWAKIRNQLLDDGFDSVLVADMSRHLELAMTYFDLGAKAACRNESVAGDAVSRIGEHMCRQSPVLVGRISHQLDGPPRDRSVAA